MDIVHPATILIGAGRIVKRLDKGHEPKPGGAFHERGRAVVRCKLLMYDTALETLDVGEWNVDFSGFPVCHRCKEGVLVPLSDFGGQGAPIQFKAWVCTNMDCGYNVKIRNGDVYVNEPITSGTMHTPRLR